MSAPSDTLRLFLFGNRGHASHLLEVLLARGELVVGVCSRPDPAAWRRSLSGAKRALCRIGALRHDAFQYYDPFGERPSPLSIAARRGIATFLSTKLRSDAFLAALGRLEPDIILVAGFHRLIPASVIASARIAAVNFHPALLPRHRGGTPNRWIIRLGELETGVTAHHMAESFDTGGVIRQRALQVRPSETWGDLELRLDPLMAEVCVDVLALARAGPLPSIPQDEDAATSEPSFKGRHQVVDWSLPAEAIRRTADAIRPKSGALATLAGRTICLWETVAIEQSTAAKQPGAILDFDAEDGVRVICGQGALRIRTVLERGCVVDATSAFRRLGARPGDRLGSGPDVC